VLLTAHRELEKLVLTGKQARIKDSVAQPYGDLVHEGQHLDPVCRDIEALLRSSQARVSGEVSVLFVRDRFSSKAGVALFLDGGIEGVYGESRVNGRRRMRSAIRKCWRSPESSTSAPARRRRTRENEHERHAHGGRR